MEAEAKASAEKGVEALAETGVEASAETGVEALAGWGTGVKASAMIKVSVCVSFLSPYGFCIVIVSFPYRVYYFSILSISSLYHVCIVSVSCPYCFSIITVSLLCHFRIVNSG